MKKSQPTAEDALKSLGAMFGGQNGDWKALNSK